MPWHLLTPIAVRQTACKGRTVYPKKYAHGFVVLCFVVVMQSFIMNSHEVFIHIHQGCFAGTGAIVRLPQRQWSKPDGYGKISQCITTTKRSKAKTVCIFLGIYCSIKIRDFESLPSSHYVSLSTQLYCIYLANLYQWSSNNGIHKDIREICFSSQRGPELCLEKCFQSRRGYYFSFYWW